jgi:hypothetical protein
MHHWDVHTTLTNSDKLVQVLKPETCLRSSTLIFLEGILLSACGC